MTRLLTFSTIPVLTFPAASAWAADPCARAFCSLAGAAGKHFGAEAIIGAGLLAAGAVLLGVRLYRRSSDSVEAPQRVDNARA